MTEMTDAKQILEWYLEAGVDETCGEEPYKPEVKASIGIKAAPAVPVLRQATTDLAQETQSAVKSSREICEAAMDLESLKQAVAAFDGCALKLTATNTVFGHGSPTARVVFVGEAPGADEDRAGVPFVGRSGRLLEKMLAAIALKREDCFITNVLPWRPPGNRTPLESEIAVCLPFLRRQIDLIAPDFIFILGGSAANALLETGESISRLRGRWMDYKTASGKNVQVLASFHPAYLLRNSGQKAKAWADFLRLKKELDNG